MVKQLTDIIQTNLDEIVAEDFLSYAVSVIKERAIPNIEDNLKPVHRRILFAMYQNKLWSKEKHKKSSNTVGMTMLLHPHGDAAIYDSMIRLGQSWKMRYPLIDVQGNVGSITGSPAAASRYTEARLSPIGDLMVKELNENSVNFIPTFDGEGEEPFVMPSLFPNILCNGNMGIAVGMSSAIAPHNLREVVDALNALIANPIITIEDILKIMPGPDFPTGGIVTNSERVKDIYRDGYGTLHIESKYHLEEKNKVTHIVFTEIPYLVNIEDIIAKVKELAVGGLIDEIDDIQNNNGRSGLEIRVILKPKANVRKNLETLFEFTGLKSQVRYGMNVLKNGSPVETNILGLMNGYLEHRHQVIINIHNHKKEKAQARLHIVEGLLKAVQDIDGVIAIVKQSSSRSAAKDALMLRYALSDIQANAILDMKISQINKMDAVDLVNEKTELEKNIQEFTKISDIKSERDKIISKQLQEIKDKFGDARRTILKETIITETVKEPENFIISLFDNNEITISKPDMIQDGKKTGVGKKSFNKLPRQVMTFSTANNLLVIDSDGKSIMIYGSRIKEMEGFIQDLELKVKSNIVYMLEINESDMQKDFFTIITKDGLIKKTELSEYNFKSLSAAIKLKEGDSVLSAAFTNDTDFAFVGAKNKILKFSLASVKATGKATLGVKTIDEDGIYGAALGSDNDKYLTYSQDGRGKLTLGKDYIEGVRAGKGQVIAEDSNIGLLKVIKNDVLIIGDSLKALRLNLDELNVKGAKAQNTNIYGSAISKIGF